MKTLMIFGGFVLFCLLSLGGCSMIIHNGLVKADETCEEKWAEIDNMLKRRTDLLPNMVATVKGYAKHEKEIFVAVAEARSKLIGAKGVTAKGKASSQMDSAISRLLMVAERYPDLKANKNFIRLQDEIAGTENRIAVARTRYNEAIKKFNVKIKKIPGSFFAGSMGLEKRQYFEITTPQDREVPTVQF